MTETHIHADYVSGSRELAKRTGARLFLSDEGEDEWKYQFADDETVLIRDGFRFRVGEIEVEVLHTPGHTPEHVSFLITDHATADQPIGVLTGDFVFVGDVGRPDLLERAAKVAGTMESSARSLFRSLQRFKELPDYLQVWPGHGAGSACGKGLSPMPQSTVGYERRFNWAFAVDDENVFVPSVLEGQPEAPRYFSEMKRINKEGPPSLGRFHQPQRLPEARLESTLAAGAIVVDVRNATEFAAGHVPATINIPLARSFTTWAGSLLPYDSDFYLIIDDGCNHCVDEAVHDLAMIGLDRMAGYFGLNAVGAWAGQGRNLQTTSEISRDELQQRLERGAVQLVDVRGATEWEEGHLPGSDNIPVACLKESLDQIRRDVPVAVHCLSGARAAIAASVLQATGIRDVVRYGGGFADWRGSGKPIEYGSSREEVEVS